MDPRLVELYDQDSPWSLEREFYHQLAGPAPQRILDLGCGTGLLCDAYAQDGHEVTGVDPAAAMLAQARRKPRGSEVEWVLSTAQNYRSERRFHLVVMTGNAFQTLLDEAAISGALEAMRSHLARGGMIAFETRNPSLDWPAQWDYRIELQVRGQTVVETRRFMGLEAGVMRFEFLFEFPGEVLITTSRIRFWSRGEIESALSGAGLQVRELWGDWERQPFDPRTTKEMVFVLEAAK